MIKTSLFLFIVFTMVSVMIENSHASETEYELTGRTMNHTPTICVIEPVKDEYVKSEKQIENWLLATKNAVNEWTGNLKQNPSDERWNMHYRILQSDNQYGVTNLDCGNIIIQFEQRPPADSEEYLKSVGKTEYDEKLDKYFITIYYLEPVECKFRIERVFWEHECYGDEYITDTINGKPSSEYLHYHIKQPTARSLTQIYTVVQHELGHALGLGHYIQKNDEGVNISPWNGFGPSPSLMIELNSKSGKNIMIRDMDIKKIYSIYGDDGFIQHDQDSEFIDLEENTILHEYYLSGKMTLNKLPTICVVESDLYSNTINKQIAEVANAAVKEWVYKLQKEQGDPHIWRIPYSIQSELDQKRTSDLDCGDIIIQFEQRPPADSEEYLKSLGKTEYDEKLDKYFITIYVHKVGNCYFAELDDQSQTHTSRYDYCYQGHFNECVSYYGDECVTAPQHGFDKNDLISSEQIQYAVQHELGYVLGLNEFTSKNEMLDSLWEKGIIESPSIMIESSPTNINNVPKILDDDIKKIHFLYGYDGFHQNTISSKNMETILATSKEVPKWLHNNAIWWHDEIITDDEFLAGIKYLIKGKMIKISEISNNSTSNENIPLWFKNTSKWWHDEIITDDEFLRSIEHLIRIGVIQIS